MKPRTSTSVLAALLGSVACDASRVALDPTQREPPPTVVRVPKVVVQHPQRVAYTHEMVLPGTLEPFEHAAIHGQVAGYLDSVEVDIGQDVQAGDVLARIFAPEVSAEVERAQASLVAARTNIKQFEEAKQLADLERERRQTLRQTERGAIAQQDVDVADAGAQMAKAQLASAEAAAKRAKADLTGIRARKQFSVVRSPFGGRITRRWLHPGALVRDTSSSGATPIVEVQRINPLRLAFEIPEELVATVKVGHALEIRYDALLGRRDRAAVTRISGAADPRTRAMRVEADLLNDDGSLAPGLYASVHLSAISIPDALVLPSRAIRGTASDRFVLVVVGGVLEKRAVTVVTDDGKQAVVADGVAEDDAVVLAGSPLATEGVVVEIAEVRGP